MNITIDRETGERMQRALDYTQQGVEHAPGWIKDAIRTGLLSVGAHARIAAARSDVAGRAVEAGRVLAVDLDAPTLTAARLVAADVGAELGSVLVLAALVGARQLTTALDALAVSSRSYVGRRVISGERNGRQIGEGGAR